jgi:hypothetical protein
MAARPNQPVTSTSPPSVAVLTKTVSIVRTDTTAFDAFVLPKGALISGAYVISQTASDAGTSASISVGSNPGTTNECIDAFDVKTASTSLGYFAAGVGTGTSVGTVLTTDTLMKARYVEAGGASTTGGPWLVKIEYYFPQQGMTF